MQKKDKQISITEKLQINKNEITEIKFHMKDVKMNLKEMQNIVGQNIVSLENNVRSNGNKMENRMKTIGDRMENNMEHRKKTITDQVMDKVD